MPENPSKQASKANATSWKPGQTGNRGGRPSVPEEVKEALRATTLPLLQRSLELRQECQDDGDRETEVKLLLGLLKKTVPDATKLEVTGSDGQPLAVSVSVLKRLSTEKLAQLRELLAEAHAE